MLVHGTMSAWAQVPSQGKDRFCGLFAVKKPFNFAALKVGEFAFKFILAPLSLANPNCKILLLCWFLVNKLTD